MICFKEVSKTYITGKGKKKEEIKANQDVSFQCDKGKITALLGVNGAGKSTSLKMLSGLLPIDTGLIEVDGISVTSDRTKALNKMGVFLDSSGLYTKLTARENIELFAGIQGVSDVPEKVNECIKTLQMEHLADRRVEGFSTGQRMKVALARAIVHEPSFIILDEPTRGLDVLTIRLLRKTLVELRNKGCGILFSSHVMQEVEKLCDQIIVIHDGKILANDSIAGILEQTGDHDLEDAFMSLISKAGEEEHKEVADVVAS